MSAGGQDEKGNTTFFYETVFKTCALWSVECCAVSLYPRSHVACCQLKFYVIFLQLMCKTVSRFLENIQYYLNVSY